MGHTKDVLSVPFSADNSQIVSAAHDHTIKLWNTLGVCKYTIQVGCYTIKLSFAIAPVLHLHLLMEGQKVINCVDVLGGGGRSSGTMQRSLVTDSN